MYGVYRSQLTRVQGLVQAFGDNGYGGSGTSIRELDYWSGRALVKFGLLAEFGDVVAGVSFTTPGLHLLGSGTTVNVQSITGDVDFDGVPDSGARTSYVEGADAEFHSPASVALGLSYRFEALTMHACGEYFAALDPYTVLSSPAASPTPGVQQVEVTYRHAAASVWNVGAGVEYAFSEKGTTYAAFITDRSAARPVDGTPVTLSTWDIYHLSGGVALEVAGTELTLGVGYAWGQAPIERDVPRTGDLPPNVTPASVDYSRLKFILGIAL